MLHNFWSKCEGIPRLDLLPHIKNSVFIFWSVEAALACARVHTIYSSSKAITITEYKQKKSVDM